MLVPFNFHFLYPYIPKMTIALCLHITIFAIFLQGATQTETNYSRSSTISFLNFSTFNLSIPIELNVNITYVDTYKNSTSIYESKEVTLHSDTEESTINMESNKKSTGYVFRSRYKSEKVARSSEETVYIKNSSYLTNAYFRGSDFSHKIAHNVTNYTDFEVKALSTYSYIDSSTTIHFTDRQENVSKYLTDSYFTSDNITEYFGSTTHSLFPANTTGILSNSANTLNFNYTSQLAINASYTTQAIQSDYLATPSNLLTSTVFVNLTTAVSNTSLNGDFPPGNTGNSSFSIDNENAVDTTTFSFSTFSTSKSANENVFFLHLTLFELMLLILTNLSTFIITCSTLTALYVRVDKKWMYNYGYSYSQPNISRSRDLSKIVSLLKNVSTSAKGFMNMHSRYDDIYNNDTAELYYYNYA